MYRKSILTVVIASFATASAAKTEKVFDQFKGEMKTLKEQLPKEKTVDARYELIQKSLSKQKDLRKKNPRQAEEQEVNMSMYMDTLGYLPEKKDFKAKDCDKYQRHVNSMMRSYSEDQKEPFVDEGLEVVSLLCKK